MNGFIVVDKPYDVTSTKIGNQLKKILQIKKIGHTGTLDPLATGVLIFALGEATKIIPYMPKKNKTYIFDAKWGSATSTDDLEGEVTHTSPIRPTTNEVNQIIPNFIGEIKQQPPIYSAIHINGERAYKKARVGQSFNLPFKNVKINSIKIMKHTQDKTRFCVECESGVYIRSLARDMGILLNTFSHVTFLRRTQDNCFSEKNSFSLEKISEIRDTLNTRELIYSMETVLDDILVVSVDQKNADMLRMGQKIPFSHYKNETIFVKCEENPICIAYSFESYLLPKRVFK